MSDTSTFLVIASDHMVAQSLANAGRSRGWQVVLATAADFAHVVAERSQPNAIVIHSQLSGGAINAINDRKPVRKQPTFQSTQLLTLTVETAMLCCPQA